MQYAQDRAQLDARWKALQREAHPDRFAAEGAAAQRVAMQWSVRINEAYQRLKDPLKRAAYLCEMQGAPVQAENNTAMPAAFLMQQMEWRESLEDTDSPSSAVCSSGVALATLGFASFPVFVALLELAILGERLRAKDAAVLLLVLAGLVLDPAAKTVIAKGQPLSLGSTEFRLLHFLVTHTDRVYSRSQLLDHVWGPEFVGDDRTVDVHISRLRNALLPSGLDNVIRTVRGSGYSLSGT
eukprot:gene18833-21428_t